MFISRTSRWLELGEFLSSSARAYMPARLEQARAHHYSEVLDLLFVGKLRVGKARLVGHAPSLGNGAGAVSNKLYDKTIKSAFP